MRQADRITSTTEPLNTNLVTPLYQRLAAHFEISRHGSAASNIQAMEGLRGLAVLLVFFVHYVSLSKPWLPPADSEFNQLFIAFTHWLHNFGNVGVDLFFVLSGYLIYGTVIKKPQPYLGFMRRRIERLYPTFTLVFLLYLLLSWLFPAQNKIPAELWPAVLYLCQNFLLLPGVFPIEPLISVAWSLSFEIMFYLLIPLLVAIARLRQWPVTRRILFFVALAALMIWLIPLSHKRSVMFVGGILLFDLLRLNPVRRYHGLAGVTTVLALGLGQWLVLPAFAETALVLLWTSLLCYLAFSLPAVARPLCWPYLRWLGNMSYSYYLLHGLALNAGFLLLGKLWPATSGSISTFVILLLPMFGFTLLSAAFLFIWVEKPWSLQQPVSRAQPEHAAG